MKWSTCSGVEYRRVEYSGVEHSGVEYSGVEYSGVEYMQWKRVHAVEKSTVE